MTARPEKPVYGCGSPDADLSSEELRAIAESALADVTRGARVLAVISDKTRDDNTPDLLPIVAWILAERNVTAFDAIIAQGTHPPMTPAEKLAKAGGGFGGTIFDHNWNQDEDLISIGEISADEAMSLTDGTIDHPVKLRVNAVLEPGRYDLILVFGATVPHEVAGFAGGAKYFFPGIAGPELTHAAHWLGACATIENVIGRVETPTRRMIEAAADRIAADVISFTSVVSRSDSRLRTHALFAGDLRRSLRLAAEISKQVHIRCTGRKFRRVIALLDSHYEDLWTGGKASYRLGPVIEEGGELIIFAPHLKCVSETHGAAIEKFGGYAPLEVIRERVEAMPGLGSNLCVAAHLAHVAFASRVGEDGRIAPRFEITLASQVDPETCRRINLKYLDPDRFVLSDFAGDPDSLIVENAGRDLYLVD